MYRNKENTYFIWSQSILLNNFIFNSSAELLARLSRLPSQIEAEDIPDLITLAQVSVFCINTYIFVL